MLHILMRRDGINLVVYDNQYEDDELDEITTAIGGGAISIHAQ